MSNAAKSAWYFLGFCIGVTAALLFGGWVLALFWNGGFIALAKAAGLHFTRISFYTAAVSLTGLYLLKNLFKTGDGSGPVSVVNNYFYKEKDE